MSKIVSMSSGAIDPINVTKRVFWRPVTSTTVLKVGQPVCYASDCVCDHKERTVDPTHLGLTIDTYAEGEQEFTGRLFIVEEPLDANIMAFAGIVKSLGSKAGADGDMIEIFTPVDGAVVPVWTDQYCYADMTIMAIRNGEADVSFPGAGRSVGVALEDKDRSGTNGLVWMRFKRFLWGNNNERLRIEDESTSTDTVIHSINVRSLQTSGRFTALAINARCDGGGGCHAWGYAIGIHVEAQVDATIASHCVGSGFWLNFTDGTPAENITAVQIGLQESGCTMTSAGRVSALTLTLQITNDVTANSLGWMFLEQNGAQQPDDLILGSNLASLPAVVLTGAKTLNTDCYGIKVYLANQPGTQQWYIPLIPGLQD